MFSRKTKFILIIALAVVGVSFASYAQADTLTFNTDPSYEFGGRDKISASLRNVGQNAYWYVSDNYWNGLSLAQQVNFLSNIEVLSGELDNRIYPRLRAIFGSENKPGVDGDPKIYIVVSRLIDTAGGYFREQDGFPRSEVVNSNEHEMLFLNAVHVGSIRMKSFLAHELQHLISFNQKTMKHGITEEVWLNELRSEIAPTLLGYDNPNMYKGSNLESRVRVFLQDPVDGILNWQNEAKDYGAINLFGQYILDHYGRSVIASMIANNKVGIESFNVALRSFGFNEDFSEIFTNWTIAALVNDCSLKGGLAPSLVEGLYCYRNPLLNYDNLHITFSGVGVSGEDKIEQFLSSLDWEAEWYRIMKVLQLERPEKHILHLEFSSPVTSKFRVPYLVYGENGIGVKYVNEMFLEEGDGEFFVEDFGFRVPKIVIIPSNQIITSGSLDDSAPKTQYNFTASLIEALPQSEIPQGQITNQTEGQATSSIVEPAPKLPDFPDGALIRASNDFKVYIIKDGYKRWIQSAEIFDFYGHLNFDAVQVVSPETLALYKDSWLVRAAGDEKVYEINGDGTRHWLDMTSEKFTQTGRLWDMVYVINKAEWGWYKEGPSVNLPDGQSRTRLGLTFWEICNIIKDNQKVAYRNWARVNGLKAC